MVPEFIGKITLNPKPSFSGLLTEGNVGAIPYYTTRHDAVSVPDSTGRDIMIFWKFPDANSEDIWFYPKISVYNPDSMSVSPAMEIYRRNNKVLSVLPVGYCFALGNCVQSTSLYGIRSWDSKGKLIFDSGNLSLKINSISIVSYDYNQVNDYVIPMAANAAVLVPDAFFNQSISVGDAPGYPGSGNSQFYINNGCIRRNGDRFSVYMANVAAYFYKGAEYDRDDSSRSGNGSDLSMPVINATLYD